MAPLAVGAVFGAVLVARGHLWAALVLVAIVGGLAQARTLSPRFARRMASGLDRFARAVGHSVGWVLLVVVFVLCFLPAAAWTALFGRRSLGRSRGLADGGWHPRSALGPPATSRRGFGAEPGGTPVARAPDLTTALALLVLVLVLDLVAGAVLTGTGLLRPEDRGDVRARIEEASQQIMQAPAVASEPWAEQFGEDLAAFQLDAPTYVPYLVDGVHPFTSAHVNTTDRERVSYEPGAGGSADSLRVAFFGGSVMFGVGQRDEYTIPSAFARVAEEHGVAVEVHNYGFPGWVAWQEFQYFERLLAAGEEYDLVVFLDGFNEFHLQDAGYSTDPTHNGAGVVQDLVDRYAQERQAEPGAFDGLQELASSYARSSALLRLADEVMRGDAPPGVAAPPVSADRRADAALDIYARATGLIAGLAGDHAIPAKFFWQPRRAGWSPETLDRLAPEVTDLSGVFAGIPDDEVYIDAEVHTDEGGARLLAEAMWDELGPGLE